MGPERSSSLGLGVGSLGMGPGGSSSPGSGGSLEIRPGSHIRWDLEELSLGMECVEPSMMELGGLSPMKPGRSLEKRPG